MSGHEITSHADSCLHSTQHHVIRNQQQVNNSLTLDRFRTKTTQGDWQHLDTAQYWSWRGCAGYLCSDGQMEFWYILGSSLHVCSRKWARAWYFRQKPVFFETRSKLSFTRIKISRRKLLHTPEKCAVLEAVTCALQLPSNNPCTDTATPCERPMKLVFVFLQDLEARERLAVDRGDRERGMGEDTVLDYCELTVQFNKQW